MAKVVKYKYTYHKILSDTYYDHNHDDFSTTIRESFEMFNKLWRLIKTYYFKLIRTSGSSHKIALAVAIGFFIGCIIPIGVWGQTVVAIALAIKLKTNPGIAYAATWISNPYSVVFMYPVFCFVGSRVIGSDKSFRIIKESFMHLLHNFSWDGLLSLGSHLALSFFVGALIFGTVLGLLGYFFTYLLFSKYRERRDARRVAKCKKKDLI